MSIRHTRRAATIPLALIVACCALALSACGAEPSSTRADGPLRIVADEPTSALDASVSAGVLHPLARTARAGTAIVIVSHDRAMLDCLCDRVLTMTSGVLAPGPPRPG
jgi:ABC-type hemin transport system ATPase subunit